MLKTSLANVTLRGFTLASKFLLVLFIARYFTPADLGVFGIMSVTIAVSLYFLGFDFYVFNTRELLARDVVARSFLIRDQMVFHAMAYLVVLPLLLVVFAGGFVHWKYAGWFYGLLVIEHLSQELSRLLITFSRPTMASTVLLIRSGLWVYIVVIAAWRWESIRSLEFIWSIWMLGGVSSILLSVYALRKLQWREAFSRSVDWEWVKRGFRTALPFFGATAALLIVQYADRYFLQSYYGEAAVGVYTFYANISNMIHVFVSAAFIMTMFPKLVSSYQSGRKTEYASIYRAMSRRIFAGTGVLLVLAAVGIAPILTFVDKQAYIEHMGVFWIMLGTVTALTVSYIPHYSLYVRNEDRAIILGSVLAMVVGVILNVVLVPPYGLVGAATATLSAMIVLLASKWSWLAVVTIRSGDNARRVQPTGSTISDEMPIEESAGA